MFLMEVMELNELKMEDEDATVINRKASELLDSIKEPVADILASSLAGDPEPDVLKAMKNYYYQKKYIDRLLAN